MRYSAITLGKVIFLKIASIINEMIRMLFLNCVKAKVWKSILCLLGLQLMVIFVIV